MTREETKAFVDALLAANPALVNEDSLDFKIRQALEWVVLALDENAMVFPYDCLSLNPLEWANLFKNLEAEGQPVHGWVFKRADLTDEEHRRYAGRTKTTYVYDVWGFYGFTDGGRTNNSDLKFQKFIDLFCFVLRQAAMTKLGLDSIEKGVDEHQYLQFKKMTTLGKGSDQMHWAPGRLEVRLCC
jgi:hypothetical protein